MSRDTQLSDSDGVFLVKTARMAVTEFLSNGKKMKLESEYEGKLYFSRRNTDSDWLKNAQKNPDVRIEFDGQSFAGRASLVNDDSLCKKISQLKYDDEKRANEPRVVLEVDYN